MTQRNLKKKVRVLLCPQCRSTNIYYEAAMMTGRKYRCGDCDYMGALVLEEDLDLEN